MSDDEKTIEKRMQFDAYLRQRKWARAKELHRQWVLAHGLVNHDWDDKYEDGVMTKDNSERRHWFLWFVKACDEIPRSP